MSASGNSVSGTRSSRSRSKRQPAERLVVEIDQRPRRIIGVRRRQHQLARFGIIVVMLARLDVDRRQLPPLDGIVEPVLEALLLHLLVAAQPIFEQQDAVIDQVPLELRRGVEEVLRPRPACRSPSPARRPRGCTSCGRTARFRPRPADARCSAGNTIASARARSGSGSATTRHWRGLSSRANMSIEPPFPAVSRPSKTTTIRWSVSATQRAIALSSVRQRPQQLQIFFLAELARPAHSAPPC